MLEALFIAGFSSPHRHVVNETILYWNAKFACQDSLEYPANLQSVLRTRIIDANIDLPDFPDSNAEEVPTSLPAFFTTESQAPFDFDAIRPRTLQPAHSEYLTAQKSPASKRSAVPSSTDRRSKASGSSTPKARLRHDDSQIQFAPIDSSPIRFDEDSQHLTEHQKEVAARQNQAAQMFPEMSSSPMAHSTALPRVLPKRLDFSSEGRSNNDQEQGPGTPTGLPDANGMMSDDLPSSPTPSSTKDASQAALDLDDDQATEDELEEPPSSPPRGEAGDEVTAEAAEAESDLPVGPDDTTVEITEFDPISHHDGESKPHEEQPVVGELEHAHAAEGEHRTAVDLASDSILPNEQLQWEEEAAEIERQTPKTKTTSTFQAPEVLFDEQQAPSPSRPAADSTANDVTRVEDSFIGPAHDDAAEEEDDVASSQGSRRSTRKRKRASTLTYTAKKQKSASPFKRFISKIWPNSQEEDDDDIGDEIVVASSQRSQSPASPVVQPDTTSQPEPTSQPVDEPSNDVTIIKQEVMPPPKRRPGRPRKSETPTPALSQSQDDASQTRSLKRRASVLSNASAADTEASSSFIKDTPAPSKSRKGRRGQTVSQTSETSSQLGGSQTRRTTRRTATAVLIPRQSVEPEAEASAEVAATAPQAGDLNDNDEITVSTPEKPWQGSADVSNAGAQAVEDRPKLTPRSILCRLRDALSDFVGMKVSTSEAREFDDVLFEFRREVHEADRRGRAQE